MAGHVRRFADMHPAAVMVSIDLPESILVRETEDRRAHSRDSLSKSHAPIGVAALRDSHSDPSSESFWRAMLNVGVGAELVEYPPGTDPDVDRGVRGDQQPRRRYQSHEEPPEVPFGEPKHHQRLHRRHRRPQLRARGLCLPLPRDLP